MYFGFGFRNGIGMSGVGRLAQPTLSAVEPITNPPEFDVILAAPQIGDVVRLEIDDDTGFVGADVYETTLDGGDLIDLTLDFGIAEMAAGTAYARLRVSRGGRTSPWSETLTISVPSNSIDVPRTQTLIYGGASSTTQSFTADLSSFVAGDTVLIFYGSNQWSSAATVNGNAATKISTDGGAPTDGRISAFQYVMPSSGGGSVTVSFTVPLANTRGQVMINRIPSGFSVGAVTTAGSNTSALTLDVTTTKTPATIVVGAMGAAALFGSTAGTPPPTWTGVTEDYKITGVGVSAGYGLAQANVQDPPVGTRAITLTGDNVNRIGAVAVVVE